MKCPKCKEELFKKTSELKGTLPAGEWDCMANISCIMGVYLRENPNINIELSQKEFSMFMMSHGVETMCSLLLDKRFEEKGRAGINSIFKEGFDFRGIKIRVYE